MKEFPPIIRVQLESDRPFPTSERSQLSQSHHHPSTQNDQEPTTNDK
ncbi:hypothetical protein [Laspinema olomoucense]|uniref:Uncharacterized protein n=1 Tax=Laspinema olomoucense D3b TaxID=2953688 RepID=A0ABT2NAN1_9CYAN|nr:hypothetical protein [Laspinema sp. D3b]MCT7979762.1 hypothetical protein [Laspinema sp. D3b]